jgi:hypothetical protein
MTQNKASDHDIVSVLDCVDEIVSEENLMIVMIKLMGWLVVCLTTLFQ